MRDRQQDDENVKKDVDRSCYPGQDEDINTVSLSLPTPASPHV